jgi:hypothetical protein
MVRKNNKKKPAAKKITHVIVDNEPQADEPMPQLPIATMHMSGGRPGGLTNAIDEKPNIKPNEIQKILHLSSSHANRYLVDSDGMETTAGYDILLDDVIIPREGYDMVVNVEDATIPAMWNNITDKNRFIKYSEQMGAGSIFLLSVSLDAGHYPDPQEICDILSVELTNASPHDLEYNIVYSARTRKATILRSQAGSIDPMKTFTTIFDFSALSPSIGPLLGYTAIDHYMVGSVTPLTGTSMIRMRHITNLYIMTNFNTIVSVIHSRSGGRDGSLARVHISDDVYNSSGVQYFDNRASTFRAPAMVSQIQRIEVRLVEESGQLVDLNGYDWEVSLQITQRRQH